MNGANLTDYLSFVLDVVGVDPENLPTSSGVATSGDINLLQDTSAGWNPGEWVTGQYVCSDLTQNLSARISSNSGDTVFFASSLPQPVATGDSYLIVPRVIVATLAIAMGTVNETLLCAAPEEAVYATYNLATDRLFTLAPDVPNQTYWRDKRKELRLFETTLGVVQSTGDEGSNTSLLVPKQFERLTLADLQNLKTPWGRAYLAFAQSYGDEIWGMA